MDSWEIWFCVVSIAQSMGCAWIYSLFQKRAYKKDIRSRHSYVLLGMLLAKEEKLPCYFSGSREEGIGETYLRLPEGIIKVFSWGVDGFAISLVGAVKVDDMLASMSSTLTAPTSEMAKPSTPQEKTFMIPSGNLR